MEKLLPVYCLVGEDDYRRREYLAGIKKRLLAGDTDSLNYEYLLAGESDVARILDAARTPAWDLFAGPGGGASRMVVVDGAESLSPDQWRKMRDYLDAPEPASCLVFLVNKPEKSWPGKKVVPKQYLFNFSPLKGGRLRDWIGQAAARRGLKLTREQVEECAVAAGSGLSAVAAGLERLSIYKGGGGSVTDRELRDLLGVGWEGSVFNLAELTAGRKAGEAVALLNHLLDGGEQPLRIFSLFAGSIRKLWRGVETWERTGDPRAVWEESGVAYFREQFLRQVKNLSTAEIPYWYRRLVETDRALKGGEKDPRLALERLLIDLSGTKPRAAAV